MTNSDKDNLIMRVAAKGDGVTTDGRFVAFSAPGDRLVDDGGLVKGSHHIEAACQHFQQCGGCSLQHLDAETYSQFVKERVANALEGQDVSVETIHVPYISKPNSRIRASLRAAKIGKELKLGFSGAGSHRIVDMQQCEILHPDLFAVIRPLRSFLNTIARKKHDFNIEMTLVDQGVDLIVKNIAPEGLEAFERLSSFAQEAGLARLSIDSGYGPETQWEPVPLTVTFGGTPVSFTHGAFLQPTNDGKDILITHMREVVGDANLVADLFSGLGTFALSLGVGRKVYAAEASRDTIGALKQAANSANQHIFAEHRDLFRRPLSTEELNRFQAIILDPPRAGAKDQVTQLAQSDVKTICYISCNPASFARDAKTLCAAGYKLKQVWPVGQFLWSTHVELVSHFVRA
ncbi:MAG: class I SAM-dependent RNA methyltransferase [Parasphingorhabdus sp.]